MSQRLQVLMILWLTVWAIPVRAQNEASPTKSAQPAVPAMFDGETKKAATTDPNYVIGPQDVLDVSVWKEPQVSRVVPVRPDGKISLPLLNDVQAAGLTPAQLGVQITESLKKYVTSPQVTVIVTIINSQRFYILGEAAKPGAYPMVPGMAVMQALSSAGGFTAFAKMKSIYVLREENGKKVKYPFNYKQAIAGKNTEQDIVLQAGDTIVVP